MSSGVLFAHESDLALPVVELVRRMYPDAVVYEEIDLRWTAPDIVAAVPGEGVTDATAGDEFQPLAPQALMIAGVLDRYGPLSRQELLKHTSLPWRPLQNEVLVPLVERGLVCFNSELDVWCFLGWPASTVEAIFSVELKLKNWRHAIAQATRNMAFSDESWVALPKRQPSDLCLSLAAASGVGVIGVDEQGAEVVQPASLCPPRDLGWRRILEEHLIEARQSGTTRRAGSPMRLGDQRSFSQSARKSGFSPGNHARAIPA